MSPSHCQSVAVYFALVCASTIAVEPAALVPGRRDACTAFGSGETEDYVVNIPGAAYTFTQNRQPPWHLKLLGVFPAELGQA